MGAKYRYLWWSRWRIAIACPYVFHAPRLPDGALCPGDVWGLEIARNLVFSRIKWLPASMGGTSFVRRGGLRSFCARAVPIVSAAEVIFERLHALWHCVWWSRVAFCIGMAASNALSRWCLKVGNRMKPCVFSHDFKGARCRWGEPRLCDGCGLRSFCARVAPTVSTGRRWSLKDSMRCAIVFGDV